MRDSDYQFSLIDVDAVDNGVVTVAMLQYHSNLDSEPITFSINYQSDLLFL